MFRSALLLFLPLAAVAGETVSRPGILHLTIESAVRMALAKNFTIEVERFQPQIARQNVIREIGRFDPNFDISASRSENTVRDLFTNGQHLPSSGTARTDSITSGLSGLTPWGLSYDLGIGAINTPGRSGDLGDEINSNASIGLNQPLLRGFGTSANLAQIRIARNNVLVSEWQLRQRIIDTVTTTDFVYNELHLAHETLRVAERSRQLALQLLSDNSKRAQIGVMAQLDVTTARAEAAARQEGVILARRQVKDNENLLKQLVTHDLEQMLSVQVEIEPPPSHSFKADVPAGITEAISLRPDYQQALLEIRNRHINLAFTKNQALPRLDLNASLNLIGVDNGFGGSFEHVGRGDRTSWSAGAIFSVPIPNNAGRASVAAAQLSSAQAVINLQRIEQQIVVDVDNASGQIITSRERIASTSEAHLLAQESLDAGEIRLRTGSGITFEVLELQKKLAEAEQAELRSRADYNKALSEYRRQTGTTLRRYNVIMQ
ncbi:MAG: Outer rane efflux protein [Chthoniobacteraceae bacterium]|nr:Outer rane efflux protein [Chthoniobacteraceae bacterium]